MLNYNLLIICNLLNYLYKKKNMYSLQLHSVLKFRREKSKELIKISSDQP